MSFLDKVFDALVDLAEKLPAVDIGSFYIVVLVAIAAFGLLVGLTFLGSRAGKVRRACRKVIAYLDNVAFIDDDNVADFTTVCFSPKAPTALRDSWVQYIGVRYGYPSEIVTQADVFDREVKRYDNIRSSVFLAIALAVVALFTFWGLGCMRPAEVGAVMCLGLLVTVAVYIVLCRVAYRQYRYAREAFFEMQDELDAKVNLQVEKDYATDASPLLAIASLVDGIVAKNIAKPYPRVTEADIAPEPTAQPEPAQAPEDKEDVDNATALEEVAAETEEKSEAAAAEENPEEQNNEENDVDAESVSDEEEVGANNGENDSVQSEENAESGEAAEAEKSEPEEPTEEQTDHADVSEDDGVRPEGEEGDTVGAESDDNATDEVVPVSDDADVAEAAADNSPFRDIDGSAEAAASANMRFLGVADVNDETSEQAGEGSESAIGWEEINDEDEEIMFGRKKKKAEKVELQQQGYDNLIVESELIEDDDTADVAEATLVKEGDVRHKGNGVRPESLEGLNVSIRPAAASSVTVSLEPEIIYVEEDLDEGDEDVKAPRLAKLPHLVDFVLTMKLSRGMKIRVAMLMLQAYNVFKNSPENKAIVIQCLRKIMQSLIADQAAAKAAAAKAAAEQAAAEQAAASDDASEQPAEN